MEGAGVCVPPCSEAQDHRLGARRICGQQPLQDATGASRRRRPEHAAAAAAAAAGAAGGGAARSIEFLDTWTITLSLLDLSFDGSHYLDPVAKPVALRVLQWLATRLDVLNDRSE